MTQPTKLVRKTSANVSERLVQAMEARAADPRQVWGLPYFLPGLNKLTGGAHRGQLSLLMARPAVGKSFWLGQDALFKAQYLVSEDGQLRYPGQVVKLVLCEMSAEQFQQRMLCQLAEVLDRNVRAGRLTPEEQARYRAAAEELKGLPIEYLDDPTSLDASLKWLDSGSKPAWFGLDYLTIHPTGNPSLDMDQYKRATYMSAGLREYTKKGPPGLVLAQMNREVEKRKPEERRPQLADLRGSGTLEQDGSGFIGGLFRPDLYTKVPDEENLRPRQAELVVLKQRNGPIGTVELFWLPSLPGFVDASEQVDELEAV